MNIGDVTIYTIENKLRGGDSIFVIDPVTNKHIKGKIHVFRNKSVIRIILSEPLSDGISIIDTGRRGIEKLKAPIA